MKGTRGTAVLIYRRGTKAVAITAQHLFRGVRKPIEVTLDFPNGEKLQGTLVAEDTVSDLAAVTLPAPRAEPIAIYLDDPKVGERITVAGYGMAGCYRTTVGVVKGPKRASNGVALWIEMTGSSRGGDSGGPMLNSSGQLLGVLWGTNGSTSVGTYNGRICQFLETQRFALPWNADLAKEKERSRQQVVPIQPQVGVLPGPTVDSIARQMAQDALSRVASLEKSVATSIAGASSTANKAGAKAAVALATAEEATGNIAKVETSVLAKAAGAAKTMAFGLLKSWGLGGGLLATAGIGIGFVLMRKFLGKQIMGLAKKFDDFTDGTKNTFDDKLDGVVYKFASVISGQPVPEFANKPGFDPYGKPFPGSPQQPQQPAPSSRPAPPDPAVEMQKMREELAELRGQLKQPASAASPA